MEKQAVLSKIQGCLLGVAIGDALGMPVETLSHEQILEKTNGAQVIDFMNPILSTWR